MPDDDTPQLDELRERIHALSPEERSELFGLIQTDRLNDYLAVRGAYFDTVTELIVRVTDDGPWAEYCQCHPEDPVCQQMVTQADTPDIQREYAEAHEHYVETLEERGLLDIERSVFGSQSAPQDDPEREEDISVRTKDKSIDDGKTKGTDDISGGPKRINDKNIADRKLKFLDDPKNKPSDDEGPKPKFLDKPSPNPSPNPPTPPPPPPDDPDEEEEPSLNAARKTKHGDDTPKQGEKRPLILQTPHHSRAVAHGTESSLNEQYERLLAVYRTLLDAYQQ